MWNYYSVLSDEIKKKRPHLAKKEVLFHQDNAVVQSINLVNNIRLEFEKTKENCFLLLGWQQSHLVFFHDFQSKFINTNNKH